MQRPVPVIQPKSYIHSYQGRADIISAAADPERAHIQYSYFVFDGERGRESSLYLPLQRLRMPCKRFYALLRTIRNSGDVLKWPSTSTVQITRAELVDLHDRLAR